MAIYHRQEDFIYIYFLVQLGLQWLSIIRTLIYLICTGALLCSPTHCFQACICYFFRSLGAYCTLPVQPNFQCLSVQLALTYFSWFPHWFAWYVFHFSGCRINLGIHNRMLCRMNPLTGSINWVRGNDSWCFNRCTIATASNLGYSTLITDHIHESTFFHTD